MTSHGRAGDACPPVALEREGIRRLAPGPTPATPGPRSCGSTPLTVINLAFGDWLRPMPSVLRTFVLATIAVPIVIYGLMPHLHGLRARLLSRERQEG